MTHACVNSFYKTNPLRPAISLNTNIVCVTLALSTSFFPQIILFLDPGLDLIAKPEKMN